MSFQTVTMQLASDVAQNGTFTVTYPTGTSKGDFFQGVDHRMVANQADMRVGRDFTISLGNTAATITYLDATTIPAGSTVIVQLDEAGEGYRTEKVPPDSVSALKPRLIDLGSPVLGVSNAISTSQSVSAGASFLINGTAGNPGVTNGAFIADTPRNVIAAWTTTSVLTITGTDEYGNTMVEKSASGTSHTGKKAFKTVTSISSSASITSATVGTGNVLGFPVFLRDTDQILQVFEGTVKNGLAPGQKIYLPFMINQTDLLAPTNQQVVSPIAGTITDFRGIVQVAVTTGGSVTLNIGSTAVTGASITIADADPAGTIYHSTAITALNTVAAGSQIQVVPAAAINTAGALNGDIEITSSGNGTFVVGDQTQILATSGDVRGTFAPTTTLDGIVGFSFVMLCEDTNYIGAPQFTG